MTTQEIKKIIGKTDLNWLSIEIFTDTLNTFLKDHFQTNDYNEVSKCLNSKPLESYITGEVFKSVDDIVIQLAKQTAGATKNNIPMSKVAKRSSKLIEEKLQNHDEFAEFFDSIY